MSLLLGATRSNHSTMCRTDGELPTGVQNQWLWPQLLEATTMGPERAGQKQRTQLNIMCDPEIGEGEWCGGRVQICRDFTQFVVVTPNEVTNRVSLPLKPPTSARSPS